MKRGLTYTSIVFCFFTLLLLGCKKEIVKNKTVYVSIQPQKYFLDRIVGDKCNIKTLIPEGTNPETYDPTPSEMLNVGRSRLYFKVGYLNFENAWLNNLQKNNPLLHVINSSTSIKPIIADAIHLDCQDSGHNHSQNDQHNHSHDGPDPHVWSSPKTALIMSQNMYNEMIIFDSKNKDYYTENFKELTQLFYSTDSVIRSYLADAPSCSFIIYHPALSYYAQEYGLTQLCIEQSGKQPTPADLKKLITLGKKENVKVVFIQTEYDQKNAETIAKELGARVVPLNLMSYDWDNEMIKIAKALALKDE